MEDETEKTLPHTCAVYGSLLEGLGNHGVIGRYIPSGDAKLLGECQTEELFSMLDLHAFPGLTKEPNHKIHVEVYKLSDRAFASVRMLEGYSEDGTGLYTEHVTPTPFGDATIYIYNYGRDGKMVPPNSKNVVNWRLHKQQQTPQYRTF
jgi:gamma-glutamylcyclotransferase (GGCT)/AIG2-like uncharacterized protein YtfP